MVEAHNERNKVVQVVPSNSNTRQFLQVKTKILAKKRNSFKDKELYL